MAHFLNMIHSKAADKAELGEEEEEETGKYIPEEKLRDEDLVTFFLCLALLFMSFSDLQTGP